MEYYTPDIEDIRVGYECERNSGIRPGLAEGFHKFIFKSFEDIIDTYKYSKQPIRTPYLTKEQIEAEGWEIFKKKSDNNYIYANKGFASELRYDTAHQMLAIYNTIDARNEVLKYPAFYGNCPSINEFRYITKLLNI